MVCFVEGEFGLVFTLMALVHFGNLELFVDQPSSLLELTDAFERWCRRARDGGRLRRASSEQVYRAMWQALAAWCASQVPPVGLRALDEATLQAYIATRSGKASPDDPLSPRYLWRLLNLVDRVQADHADAAGRPRNASAAELIAAQPALRHVNAADAEPLPEHLRADEAKRLLAFLSAVRPRGPGRPEPLSWQELRNRTAVALQLGAGLGPGEVRALRVADVACSGGRVKDLPWKLRVAASGQTPERETPVAPWAGRLLRHWMQVRAEQGIAGDWLFPSTRSGKPWGKVAQYEAARRVLDAADIGAGGSFRLRHTFALRQLRRGHPAEQVAQWLGVVDPAVMARYRRVLGAPVDDVA
jgi:integrase